MDRDQSGSGQLCWQQDLFVVHLPASSLPLTLQMEETLAAAGAEEKQAGPAGSSPCCCSQVAAVGPCCWRPCEAGCLQPFPAWLLCYWAESAPRASVSSMLP